MEKVNNSVITRSRSCFDTANSHAIPSGSNSYRCSQIIGFISLLALNECDLPGYKKCEVRKA